jgi:DNA-binding transcriptional ArsR family regulator
MVDITDIAQVAALLGDPARANILFALKDDGALSATELAHVAGVAPNTASGHLARLKEVDLISVRRSGRWRYYRLARPEVAHILEDLEALAALIAPPKRASARSDPAIRYARRCYDHLAGTLRVRLTDALVDLRYLKRTSGGFAILDEGRSALAALGIELEGPKPTRRPLVRRCPDWSEGRAHVGGVLAAALFEHFVQQGWLRPKGGERAVELTPDGKLAFREHFDLAC